MGRANCSTVTSTYFSAKSVQDWLAAMPQYSVYLFIYLLLVWYVSDEPTDKITEDPHSASLIQVALLYCYDRVCRCLKTQSLIGKLSDAYGCTDVVVGP